MSPTRTTRAGKWWRGIKAFGAYRWGRNADEETQQRRGGVCAGCDGLVGYADPLTLESRAIALVMGTRVYFTCGEELVEVPGRACGCGVLAEEVGTGVWVTVGGRAVEVAPAGKPTKARQRCPRGLW